MKERGMIFNGEMVRAILDGRKTQTRRIMQDQPVLNGNFYEVFGAAWSKGMTSIPAVPGHSLSTRCPFGVVSDRIWVRETFQGPLFDYDLMDSYCKDSTPFEKPEFCVYKADEVPAPEFYDADGELHCRWRPSIHMPRWASRITLEITSIRVERLRSMSQEDARAEGVIAASGPMEAGLAFRELWDSIYGPESWQANPWVWVIEFKRVEEVNQ
ncbi:morphogenetic protein [Raoultella ornithinolytica]|uniref:morphogenetic protein n=1 Tax=Raoultella ornithinolytica TaxID=54291 RepID=UPI0029363550|nr:morphogenetic protein [Raoultella ornithinolytica]HEC2586975.1 morphogenetic protein [Raoultella ornithinolytica]HEC2622614.1 morphogenetic protein [Raoultella ornithinolytica]